MKKVYYLFLGSHLLIWTLIPTITNINLPLDTIEALAWGSNLEWGYNKHPPLSAFAVDFIYKIFGNQDWAFYFLSQLFVVTAFISVFVFAKNFLNNQKCALISLLILEGIFFYNYTSPEFNVNISQMPFWALSVLFTWRCIKNDKALDYIILGLLIGLGFLSKYLFLYLILSIKFLFIYLFFNKKIRSLNFLLVAPIALLIIFPHLIWLVKNDFITISYGLQRTGDENGIVNHLIFPIIFILKQIGILLPFLFMCFFLLKKFKIPKIKFNDKTKFIIFIFFIPLFFMTLTSMILGAKIRTMWMSPFYLFIGVSFIHFFKDNLNLKSLKKFYVIFIFLFLFSPITYAIVSITNEFKRTDYPGKEIARLVQNRWDDNFVNEIKIVVGDEWYAGNLSYHLNSRPQWFLELKKKERFLKEDSGVIYTGNPTILKKVCPGIYGTIKPVGYCMIGKR